MTSRQNEKELLQELLTLIDDYREKSSDRNELVVEHQFPEELKSKLNLTLPAEGTGKEQVMHHLREYLKYSVKTGHPHYANQLFGGFNLPGFLGEVIASLSNTSMYTYEVAPVATLMEMEIVRKMNSFVGWERGEGTLLTGGSNTNLVAMMLGRNQVFPQIKDLGASGLPPITAFVSERSHFSFSKAANVLGLGRKHLIRVAVDDQGRMDPQALKREIAASRERGEAPFFVGITAGSTETGSFDPIQESIYIAHKEGMWAHVDGSWGGSLIISPKYRHLFEGLHLADSFSWNPHKLMNLPLISSVLLVRQKGTLLKHLSTDRTEYIFHNNETSDYDLGPASLQCGKRNDALKLWLAWQYYGDKGYAERMDYLMGLARYATEKVLEDPELELMFPTQTLNVNFRFVPARSHLDLDVLNERARAKMIRDGKAMINYCHLSNGLSIRMVFLNPDLTRADFDYMLETYKKAAREVAEEMRVMAG